MRATASLLILFALAMALPRTVSAKCAAPGLAVAPHTGARVPESSTLWIFTPAWRSSKKGPSITVLEGKTLIANSVKEVSRNPAFVTYRVQVEAKAGRKLTLRVDGKRAATYHVRKQVQRTRLGAPSVSTIEHKTSQWTCSHTDALFLTASVEAPAYRVEWRQDGAEEIQEQMVFPHHTDDFWLRGHRKTVDPGMVGLGHLNCFNDTINKTIQPGTFVRLTGLYADGAEAVGGWRRLTKDAPASDLAPTPESAAEPIADPVQTLAPSTISTATTPPPTINGTPPRVCGLGSILTLITTVFIACGGLLIFVVSFFAVRSQVLKLAPVTAAAVHGWRTVTLLVCVFSTFGGFTMIVSGLEFITPSLLQTMVAGSMSAIGGAALALANSLPADHVK